MDFQFGSKHVVRKDFDIGFETQKKNRLTGKWVKDIHYVEVNSRVIRYNISLVRSWLIHHKSNPELHQRDIDLYLGSLEPKLKRVGRLSKTPTSVA